MLRYLLAVLVPVWPALALADTPLAAFAQQDDFFDVSISPQGDYVAALMPDKDRTGIVFVHLADGRMQRVFLDQDEGIARYFWVSPKRVVVQISDTFYSLDERPGLTGELAGIDADGGHYDYLFGFRGKGMQLGSNIRKGVDATRGWAQVIDPMPKDGHHAIISVLPMPSNRWYGINGLIDESQYTIAYRLDVDNGRLDRSVAAPIPGMVDFVTDAEGTVRYAVGSNIHSQTQTYYKNSEEGGWSPLNAGAFQHAEIQPLRFSADGNKVYLASDEGGDKSCLVEHDIKANQRHKLSCDDTADLNEVIFSAADVPVAATYEAGKPRLQLLDSKDPLRAKLAALQDAFPGKSILPVSHTTDGSKLVVLVSSDRDPGTYYLFDTGTMQAASLFKVREAVNPDDMGERRPISYAARDGTLIYGYLTLPPGREAKNLPLVVNPHGGPFGIRESWGWNADAQFLATHGYAVLQVNFRGSSGYGHKFYEAGRNRWDSTMIDDITDGARWTIGQGLADPGRVCIYGGSYGGYAALESAVREPELYRCTVDYAGVYDLVRQKATSDFGKTASGRTYVDEFIGATPERLLQASPAALIDRLKAAIMIVHGTADLRVPYSQATELRDALDKRHYPYEWLVKSGEGHGFYLPENREEFYTRLLAFLDKNIGTGSPALAAAPAH